MNRETLIRDTTRITNLRRKLEMLEENRKYHMAEANGNGLTITEIAMICRISHNTASKYIHMLLYSVRVNGERLR